MGYLELKLCSREDEVKHIVLGDLNLPLDMRYNIDCYSENVLFEFKYDKDIKHNDVLAQTMYYMNILFESGDKIPTFICLLNINECSIYESAIFKQIYEDSKLFITGSPSNPSDNVNLSVENYKDTLYFYSSFDSDEDYTECIKTLKDLIKKGNIRKNKIQVGNVKRAYNGYVRQLGEYIIEQSNSSGVFEFRADAIGKAKITGETLDGNYVINFIFDNGSKRFDNIPKTVYDSYWKQWKRIETEEEAINVFKTIYDLLGFSDRRTKGQFYTPKHLAVDAWNRIINTLGENFWENGKWRIWDCCAGTGNLELGIIPESCMQYTYLSTLDIEEVDQLKQNFPISRKIFQYNFLNDHTNKLPRNLKDDMDNEEIQWLFLINPPYVESQGGTNVQSGTTQSNIQDIMKYENLGNASREMFAQFLYRIERDFKNKYIMGLFSSVKVIVSSKFKYFREYWRPYFKGGFVCNASEHFQCKGEWPLIFSVFDRRGQSDLNSWRTHWYNLNLIYDIYDKDANVIGQKKFKVHNSSKSFRNFLPDNPVDLSIKLPLLSSGIKLSKGKQYCSPYAPKGFLATMVFIGPDFQQQNRCFITSGINNTNHNNTYITIDNYKNVLTAFALYKAPTSNWLNNKDFFEEPNRDLTEQEISDCILYSLVSSSNQTATYKFPTGDIIINKLNPLDQNLFDFSNCSEEGINVFNLLKDYLYNDVKFDKLSTIFGKGRFLGLYQYQSTIDEQCFGIKFSNELIEAIEELRMKIEKLSIELCL